ncbi:MAG: hypothetical protein IPJ84_07805 [Bdellovibrionales bacterium]|nr:hypothetical protein [Bdellovibrionales bacterium]
MKCELGAIPAEGLTVGTEFELNCQSSEPLTLNAQSLRLELPKAEKFSLRILETKSLGEHEARFIAASYKAGQVAIDGATLTDGAVSIPIEKLTFEVQSVLDPNEQPPQAVPAFSAEVMWWPVWFFVLVASVVLVVGLLVALLYRRTKRKKSFQLWLESVTTPMSPFDQMNKALRYAGRERDPEKQLIAIDGAVREYLCKLYAQDFRKLDGAAMLGRIRKSDRKFLAAKELVSFFEETGRVRELLNAGKIDAVEALNRVLPPIHELAHELANRIEAGRKKGRGQ